MTKYDTQTPYIASNVILEKDGAYAFVLRRNTGWMDEHYGLPAGKVENDEPFTGCAVREAKEEVGVVISPDDLQHVLTMHRYEQDEANWVDVFFVATKWEGEPHNAEPINASKFEWLDPHNLPDNMIPNVRYALEQIRIGEKYCEFNWEELK